MFALLGLLLIIAIVSIITAIGKITGKKKDLRLNLRSGTIHCPYCGSPANVRGNHWECPFCGESGVR